MSNATDEFLPTRRSLLNRLKDLGDEQSWKEFYDLYSRFLQKVATQSGLTSVEAQEVVQETLIGVAKKIGEFQSDPGRGTFKGWLMAVTRRRIADAFENRARQSRLAKALPPAPGVAPTDALPEDETDTSTLDRVPDPESLRFESYWNDQWQRHMFNAALARVKVQVSPKKFQAFELYVHWEWPVTKVAKTLGISATSVYLAKHRIGILLKKEIARLRALHEPGLVD